MTTSLNELTSKLLDSIGNRIQGIVEQLAKLEADYATAASDVAADKKGAQKQLDDIRNQVLAKKADLAAFQGAYDKEVARLVTEKEQKLFRAQQKYRDELAADYDHMLEAAKKVDEHANAMLSAIKEMDYHRGLVAGKTRDGFVAMQLGNVKVAFAEGLSLAMGIGMAHPELSSHKRTPATDLLLKKDHVMSRVDVPKRMHELPEVE